MEEPEARDVVALRSRHESLAWIRLGLCFLLAAAAMSRLLTWYLLRYAEPGAPNDLHSALAASRSLGLANSVIYLVGTVAMLIGVTMSGRLARNGAARILFGVAAAGLLLMVASQLFGLAFATRLGGFGRDSSLFDAMRWSRAASAGSRPLVYIALLLALRSNPVAGQPAGDGLLAAVGLVAVANAALNVAAIVGHPVELGIGRHGVLLELAMDAVVLGGVLVAVPRARPRDHGAAESAHLAAVGGAGKRAATGLDIFGGALIARAVIALLGPLGLLLDATGYTVDAMSKTYLLPMIGNLGCSLVMVVGINRLRAAAQPAEARVAAGVAALLLLCCAVVDAQFLLAAFRLNAESGWYGAGNELRLVGAAGESLLALVAWLALLRCLSALGPRIGDGAGARGAAAVAVALVIVVLASAMFDRRALVAVWLDGPTMWLPLVGAIATLMVAALLARLARGLGARMRSGSVGALPLARAVARERDGDG